MKRFDYDLVFAGCGLSAGLAAWLIHRERPSTRMLILDAGKPNDYDQTWSFPCLPSDKTASQVFRNPGTSWLAPLIYHMWPAYDVRFPGLERTIASPYVSLRHSLLMQELRKNPDLGLQLGVRIKHVEPQAVTLEDGRTIRANCVIDARGWQEPAPFGGFQKFLGLQLKLKHAHGLVRPLLMDATVPQVDGFRFIYTLPWSPDTLLIEDTHYSLNPQIDEAHYKQEILHYAQQQGWDVEDIFGSERGALPLPLFGEELAGSTATPTIGVRAGLFHPTTGYSIFEALQTAEWLVQQPRWDAEAISRQLRAMSRERWKQHEFHRRLNNMFFLASADDQRYRILEKFYELDEGLIARFYAGKTSAKDKVAILSGKPPVPVSKGIYHFFNRAGVHHATTR